MEHLVGHRLDYVLVNKYSNIGDSIGFHSDDERDLLPGSTIVSYSSGATRRFLIRPKNREVGVNSTIEIPLGHDDLCIMDGTMQKTHEHSVPKKKVTQTRFN